MEDHKDFTRKEYTPMRKAIASAMHNSLQSGSQLTMAAHFDATKLLAVRKIIKEQHEQLGVENSTVNDIVVYVLSRAIKANPSINGIIGEGYFDEYSVAHLAIAVDTPKGLITPVIRNASEISLSEITVASKELIAKAMEGKLRMDDITGGTMTISNLGLSGVTFFTPVLNPPQAALLGVGSPIKTLRLNGEKVEEYSQITLSLTMDHGPNDGLAGAKFIGELVKAFENLDETILK